VINPVKQRYDVASPDEAREMLQLEGGGNVNF